MLAERSEFTGEFICRVTRDQAGRDEMTVTAEIDGDGTDELSQISAEILRRKAGVGISVAFAKPGALAELTGIESRQKPQRLIDDRFA